MRRNVLAGGFVALVLAIGALVTGTAAPPAVAADSTIQILTDTSSLPKGVVGEAFTLQAQLTHEGQPVSGASVDWAVVSGPNLGRVETVTSNSEGIASFSYVGATTGIDRVRAKFVDADGDTVGSGWPAVQWLESLPAAIVISQTSDSTPVGGALHTVTATVTNASGQPVEGVWLLLNVAQDLDLSTHNATSDSSGNGTFTFAGETPGSAELWAEIIGTELDSNRLSMTWTPIGSLVLTPEDAPSPTGTQHTVTATAADKDGNPVTGVTVSFVVEGANPGGGDAATGASGTAQFPYTGRTVGVDKIRASFTDADGNLVVSNEMTKGWASPNDTQVALSPPQASTMLLGEHTVYAVLTSNLVPIFGNEVQFTVVNGPNAGLTGTATTDAHGIAEFSYWGYTPGTDTIQASYDDDFGPIQSNTVTNEWLPGYSLTVTPETAAHPVGSQHTVTVTLADPDGNPVAGETVYTFGDGANGPAAGAGLVTDAAGSATTTYLGLITGSDRIGAEWTNAGGTTFAISNTAIVDWVEPSGVTLALAPVSGENPVGADHTVTATLMDGAVPLAGVEVSFAVTGSNVASGTGTTDVAGVASFTYTGAAAGSDSIVASATVDGAAVTSNTVTKEWVEPSGVTLALAPVSGENPVGADHTVTATLLDGAVPLAGVEVSFAVSGPNATSGTGTTDVAGVASFTYSGAAAGSDSIVASATVDGAAVTSNTVSKTWVDAGVFDEVELRALWGPAANRSLAYENGGTLTAGDYVVDPDTGVPTSIDGTGTLASSSGSGDATIAFHLTFDAGTNKWGGTVEIDDPGAGFAAEIPVFAGPQRITRDGNRVEGTLYGIKRLSTPQKCFELHFVIIDNNGASEEPVTEIADGHIRLPARWATHETRDRRPLRNTHHRNRPGWRQ